MEWQIEYETLSIKKEPIYMRKNFVLTKDTSSQDIYALIVAKDITKKIKKRLESELALKKQKKELETALYDAEQRLKVIDGLCGEYNTVFYVNMENKCCIPYVLPEDYKNSVSLGQYKELEFFEQTANYINDNIIPEDRKYVREMTAFDVVFENLKEKDTYTINYRIKVSGKIEHAQLCIVRIGDRYEQVWAIRSIENIVREERKRQKELKEALEKAKKAEKAKTNFLLNMSHDIRTPMNAIFGFNILAQKNIDDKEKALEALRKSEMASRHLLNLINEVLEMARIESGKMELNEQVICVKDHFDEIVEMFASSMQTKGINFVCETDFKEKYIYSDGTRIMQVVTNLLSNALKFTAKGGTIFHTVKEIKVKDGYAEYEIHVKDTGVGMGEEFQKKLFNAFEREKNTTASGVVGTGIGLCIAKNIANLMKGSLTCKSEIGKGTDFTFKFRAKIAEKPKEIYEQHKEQYDFSNRRVLLVEDNQLNREIAIEILLKFGFMVESASDGDIAVDVIKNSEPGYFDLVFMDIQMPNMDGYTATKEIRKLKNKKLAEIPIIAMTANAFAEDKQKAFDAGMNGHFSKPVNIQEVFDIIKDVLK